MKKNKLIVFLFGVVATVSSLLIVVSVLIAGGTAGFDSVFSEKKQQAPIQEMEKTDFYFSGDSGDLAVKDISAYYGDKVTNVVLDLTTKSAGVTVSEIRYEITDGSANYTGNATFGEGSDTIESLSEIGNHKLKLSAWHDLSLVNPTSRKIRIFIFYENSIVNPDQKRSCVVESSF